MTTALLITGWVAALMAMAYAHDWTVRRRRRGDTLAWAARNGVNLTDMTADESREMSEMLSAFKDAGHNLDEIGARVARAQRGQDRELFERMIHPSAGNGLIDLERRSS